MGVNLRGIVPKAQVKLEDLSGKVVAIDAYNALIIKEQKIATVYSFDKHYERIAWIKRVEPE